MVKKGKRIFRLLSAVLEYPTPSIVHTITEAIELLTSADREAAARLDRFRQFCRATPLSAVEDVYRKTFELSAGCCPFVGHHLFGQDRSRSMFAAKVKEEYLSHIGAEKKEAPDHIAVMLRSLVVQESVEDARELISYCLIPALKKMLALLKDGESPYRDVLCAVLLTLQSNDRETRVLRREQFAVT